MVHIIYLFVYLSFASTAQPPPLALAFSSAGFSQFTLLYVLYSVLICRRPRTVRMTKQQTRFRVFNRPRAQQSVHFGRTHPFFKTRKKKSTSSREHRHSADTSSPPPLTLAFSAMINAATTEDEVKRHIPRHW